MAAENRRASGLCDNRVHHVILSKGLLRAFSGPDMEPLWASPGMREAHAGG